MVVHTESTNDDIDRIFQALAAATRRDILVRTIEQELSVSSLAREYDMSFAAVQKHVAVLEAAGLVVKRAEGRERLVRADPNMIVRARALLDQYEALWRTRVSRLDAIFAAESPAQTPATAQETAQDRTTEQEGE
ncbi:metalloregulator ArsR/SmtB family transcription factor [Microbacterium sp. BWT-B31]|uniref:ArsR/SmtB family transcription factor n=1 Tax=Microbacterium sp. BWT-B31 TaxID=3232072 RepID=UPI003527F405